MDSTGRHLLAELFDCDPARLDDAPELARALREAAAHAGARVVAEVAHPFAPHGVTCVAVIEESHLSIHTWPESGYAAVDFYSCGARPLEPAIEYLAERLHAGRVEILEVARGGDTALTLAAGSRRRLR